MKECRSEFDANEILATTKVRAAKADWTTPGPNRLRRTESLFDRVLKALFPIHAR